MSSDQDQAQVVAEVWWGPDGIDAMTWADGSPYEFNADGGGA